jgi:hypothetical protein
MTSILLVVVDVDLGLLPLAGRDLAVEHDVNLAVRAVLHLRKLEVGHDQAAEAGGTPDVTTLAAEVGTVGVEHVRGQEDAGDLHDVVGGATDSGGQGTKTDGGGLADDDP